MRHDLPLSSAERHTGDGHHLLDVAALVGVLAVEVPVASALGRPRAREGASPSLYMLWLNRITGHCLGVPKPLRAASTS